MLVITRKEGEEFTVYCDETKIEFKIKRIRGEHGKEKVEITAQAPKNVSFSWLPSDKE